MVKTMQLDHIVINVKQDMDVAETTFADLGFSLTPRGYHTLGSMNALAMFGTDYLELLGFPADAANLRPELAEAPMGLNGHTTEQLAGRRRGATDKRDQTEDNEPCELGTNGSSWLFLHG